MKFRFILLSMTLALLLACNARPEEQIEASLKQVQSSLPKDVGNGAIQVKACYERETRTIVYGFIFENLTRPLQPEELEAYKREIVSSLSGPALASDPIWELAGKADATFRYECCLPDGSPAGSFTLSRKDYRR